MNIYIITYFIFAIAAFIEWTSKKNNVLFAIIGYLYILALGSIRWKTGTDWDNYCDFFNKNYTLSQYLSDDKSFEIGYRFLNYFSGLIYHSYSFFLAVCTIFSIYTYINFCRYANINKYPVTVLLFFWSMLPFGGIFCTRQLLALLICVYSLKYVIKREIKPFIICIVLATTFHISAIVFLVSYYLYNKKFNTKKCLTIIVVSILSGSLVTLIINFLIDRFLGNYIVTKLFIYQGEEYVMENSSLIAGIIKRLLTIPLFIYYVKKNGKTDSGKLFTGFLNIYVFGTCIYFLFATASLVQLTRLAVYFQFFEIPLFYYIIRYSKNITVYTYVLAFCFLKIYNIIYGRWTDLYIPFETIFDNTFKSTL